MMFDEKTILRLVTLKRTNIIEKVKEIRQPVLILVGSLDIVGRIDDAQFIKDRIPQSIIISVNDAGHYLFLEKQSKIINEIKKFLQN